MSSIFEIKYLENVKIATIYTENACPLLPKMCSLPANGESEVLQCEFTQSSETFKKDGRVVALVFVVVIIIKQTNILNR